MPRNVTAARRAASPPAAPGESSAVGSGRARRSPPYPPTVPPHPVLRYRADESGRGRLWCHRMRAPLPVERLRTRTRRATHAAAHRAALASEAAWLPLWGMRLEEYGSVDTNAPASAIWL